ncbi:hypothetical protein [Telluribacter sp. SYSU D00476]|uniref:hypothetical protein n=1 Tax=Telluribacter sp. SYSU D00476 TaxID=2811430 RepID=UPI001FF35010|nr:hypothetical protein [Telluribacter sp. SYSU D00476]
MSTPLIKLIYAVYMLLFTVTIGCENLTDNRVAPGLNNGEASKRGFGKSTEFPVGREFTLPAGITLQSDTIPAFDKFECDCKKGEACERGSGGLVKVCLNFQNSTQGPITVTLPLGLIFVSITEEVQNGLLIKVETFEVPADGYLSIGLNLYCLNAVRDVPSPYDKFVLGPVTENAEIAELARLIEGKDLGAAESKIAIQNAVWDITDRDGLTKEIREELARLP